MTIEKKHITRLIDQLKKDQIQRVVVGAVLFNPKGEVLVLKRSKSESFMSGIWEIPSGKVEDDEDIVHALTRETKEETGLEIASVEAYLGYFDYNSKSGTLTRQLNFLVKSIGSDVVIQPNEHEAFQWIPCEDSKKLKELGVTATPDILSARNLNLKK